MGLRPVVVLGLPKCGTTSLNDAFVAAGLRSVHWALDVGKNSKNDKQLREWGTGSEERLVGRLIQSAVMQNKPPFSLLPQVDAFAEINGLYWADRKKESVRAFFPQVQYLQHLLQAYPDAHFILNVRDHGAWARSVSQHNDMQRRLTLAELPNLPRGSGSAEELMAWAEWHHQRVIKFATYSQVRFLRFDIDVHGAAELSAFLGREMKWPHSNATKR
ncbi:unnamed protein product [Effrenium voratum]|uniref:Sulfotransferase family protein n=1 Tax=Effrenium voratum TaxID=2562239 RepID=A0AA36MUD7_9DINO|nr:unnamed protein product [Effrenium voratum]